VDEALEAVRATREVRDRARVAGVHEPRVDAEDGLGRRSAQGQSSVQEVDDAAAEGLHLGEGVDLASDVVDDQRLTALQVRLFPAEPPAAVAAVVWVHPIEELVERHAAVAHGLRGSPSWPRSNRSTVSGGDPPTPAR
jgi:hypothetical protein